MTENKKLCGSKSYLSLRSLKLRDFTVFKTRCYPGKQRIPSLEFSSSTFVLPELFCSYVTSAGFYNSHPYKRILPSFLKTYGGIYVHEIF